MPTNYATLDRSEYQQRTWVTRPRPGIDRCASAWLIRRFIDPDATFAFASAPPGPRSRSLAFDMYGGGFGHEGGGCTFDTLVRSFAVEAPHLNWLATVVRTVDLKLDSATVPEAATMARLVEGMRATHDRDEVLLERGIEMIEALYRSAADAAPVPARVPGRPSRKRARPARARRTR